MFHTLHWHVSDCSWMISNTYICVWFSSCTLALCEKTAADQRLGKLNAPKRSKIREQELLPLSDGAASAASRRAPGRASALPAPSPGLPLAPPPNPPPHRLQLRGMQHLSPQHLSASMALPCRALGQDGPLSLWDIFQGTGAGKVPGGLGTVPILFTPTSLASLNTLSPPHHHPGCWPLPRGINHMRGEKEEGQCPAKQREGR